MRAPDENDAEAVGFNKYIGSSQINANPMDSKDYPGGVWNLPPTYIRKWLKKTQIKKMQKKFISIGESDRFTIKFIKPSE